MMLSTYARRKSRSKRLPIMSHTPVMPTLTQMPFSSGASHLCQRQRRLGHQMRGDRHGRFH